MYNYSVSKGTVPSAARVWNTPSEFMQVLRKADQLFVGITITLLVADGFTPGIRRSQINIQEDHLLRLPVVLFLIYLMRGIDFNRHRPTTFFSLWFQFTSSPVGTRITFVTEKSCIHMATMYSGFSCHSNPIQSSPIVFNVVFSLLDVKTLSDNQNKNTNTNTLFC